MVREKKAEPGVIIGAVEPSPMVREGSPTDSSAQQEKSGQTTSDRPRGAEHERGIETSLGDARERLDQLHLGRSRPGLTELFLIFGQPGFSMFEDRDQVEPDQKVRR